MHANTDIHSIRGDTDQHTLTASVIVHHEHESNNIALYEDLIPGVPLASDPLPSPTTGEGEACGGESMIHPIKPDQEHSDIQLARNKFDHEHSRLFPQSDSDQVVLPMVPEEGLLLELPVVPACGPPPTIDIDSTEVVVCSQVPQVSYPKAISETVRHDSRGDAHLVDPLSCTPMLHAEFDRIHTAGLMNIHLTDEETQDVDYAHKNFPSSLPPSSSPPQLFPSSPCVSSQSSACEPPATTLVLEKNGPVGSLDYPHFDHLVPVTGEEPRLQSEHYTVTAPTAERSSSESHPTSCVKGSALSKKRTTSQRDAGESYESQPNKHSKQGSNRYRPPTPMRATLASQTRQFRKLAAPFRPPSKLPVARDRPFQAMTNRIIEPTGCSRSEVGDKCSDQREPVTHVSSLHNKGANTSRSATQFKSPLVNRDSDSCTIRLTPAVQTLERKLQLLKRAIKVKEDNEEGVLVRLARKWTEAGREVAYDIWDATKDTGDFEGRTTLVHGSYGWRNADDGNVPWGWETKLGDVGEVSCDRGTPTTPEEDDEVGFSNTLGNMLRQIGIAPEIFGWDDDKETFCD